MYKADDQGFVSSRARQFSIEKPVLLKPLLIGSTKLGVFGSAHYGIFDFNLIVSPSTTNVPYP